MKRFFSSFLFIAMSLTIMAQMPEEVRRDFALRFEKQPCQQAEAALRQAKTPAEREAMEFLYAYMDQADMLDYSPQFFLENARISLRGREELPWGKTVPDREWRHFVLPVRVNNENLDTFRTACYEDLRRRVSHLSMREAVLEVNHWCHRYVTYRPSDMRTSSPLASMKTATGRCGEESTFTVAALRAVGIPARQVYTPRWAHTDDNHAWVEAWVDGKWYFLGACEPAPRLNMAWFNQPASRGMLMNTNVMGRYKGEEQILKQLPQLTTINVTENYAPTVKTTIEVTDTKGHAVKGAAVRFGLYNYAEFYSLYQTQTDSLGQASLISGLGDMLVWAAEGGRYGFAKVRAGEKKACKRIVLDHKSGERFETEINIVPPSLGSNIVVATAEEEAVNNRRLAYEDSLRLAYVAEWPDDKKIGEIAEVLEYDTASIKPLFHKSEGNYLTLYDLLNAFKEDTVICVGPCKKPMKEILLDMLNTVSDKDLSDFDIDVLTNHMQGIIDYLPTLSSPTLQSLSEEDFRKYVLSPRIGDEMLSPWRTLAWNYFSSDEMEAFQRNPQHLAEWINKNIRTQEGIYRRYISIMPEAAMLNGYADSFSKGLCFVALARSMGIPSRLDPVTLQFQYMRPEAMDAEGESRWQKVDFSVQKAAAPVAQDEKCRLSVDYEPRRFMENPAYYQHFTLSRITNGMPVLMNYAEDATWEKNFKKGAEVDAGDYLLVSGTRMADGSVLARLNIFPVTGDTCVALKMREDKQQVQVIGSFNAEDIYYDMDKGMEQNVLAKTGRGYYVVGLLKANNEPTLHILHDIELQRDALEGWGRTLLMLFPTREEYDLFMKRHAEFPNLPKNLHFGVDSSGAVARDIFSSGITSSEERPVILVGDTFNRVVFFSQGYTIGMGEQLAKIIGKL